jgi:hypothetical protein
MKEGTMKKILMIAAGLMMLLAYPMAAMADDAREVSVGLNSVYVPASFDSNTDAYVVVSGIFQNGCYKWSRAEIMTRDTFTHEITPKAIVTPGMCIMVLIPFQKEIRLGKLEAGKHTLKFLNGDGPYIEKNLVVEE